MKVKFLVQIQKVGNLWKATCNPVLGFGIGKTRAEAIARITRNLEEFVSTTGKEYVSQFKGHGKTINCPESYTSLPIDSCYCKLSDRPCPIQGQVNIEEQDAFMSACTASSEEQAGVIRAITSGRYTGFHHVLGRYLCPSCEDKNTNEKRVNFNYHYQFELSLLSTLVDLTENAWEELRIRLLKESKSMSATLHALCAPCITDFVGTYIPEMSNSMETIELELYR